MTSPWRQELWVVLGLTLGTLSLGFLIGSICWLMLLSCFLYLGWHLYNLNRLERWFGQRKKYKILLPDAPGIWGEIFYHFYRLQRRNRKHKRKLSVALERFRNSTAAVPDAAVVLNTDHDIEWFNKAACQLLGLEARDKKQPITNLIRCPDFCRYLTGHHESEFVDFVSPTDPDIMLRGNVIPHAGERYLLIVRDITSFYRSEQIRRDFVANLSHELNTPLTVIAGFVELMGDSQKVCDSDCQHALTLIDQQVIRMRAIVGDMLLLSRLESELVSDITTSVTITDLLQSIYEEAQVLNNEKNHHITLDIEETMTIYGHAAELRSAFSNLVSNAIRYTPPNGDIQIRWYRDEQGLHFEVDDTGEGIAPKHIPYLARRFYRVDTGRSRSQGGTGLGLAIVHHVLLRHQGQLHIDSVPGEGSIFRCDFPLTLIHHLEDKIDVSEARLESA